MGHQLLGIMSEVVKIVVECTYEQGEMKKSKGEEWSSKGTDRCPLTVPYILGLRNPTHSLTSPLKPF
jgi:hypothetical protein